MHAIGFYKGFKDINGEKVILFSIEELGEIQKLEDMKNKKLVIDAEPFREKKSLQANRYFWELVGRIARAVGNKKWTQYLLQLDKYGVWVDLCVKPEAIQELAADYRIVEVVSDQYMDTDLSWVRCYRGISKYNTKEMSDLIDGTVADANDLRLDTATQEELAAMMAEYQKDWERLEKRRVTE